MLDDEIKIEGDKNIVLNNIKDSSIVINHADGSTIFKGIYDLFHEADKSLRYCIDLLFNRHITFHWRTIENQNLIHQSIYAFNAYVEGNKFYLKDSTYHTFKDYIESYNECDTQLDLLTMAIASMEFSDMDIVYNSYYDTVKDMMDAFYHYDKHPAYPDFADRYDAYTSQFERANKLIEAERQK